MLSGCRTYNGSLAFDRFIDWVNLNEPTRFEARTVLQETDLRGVLSDCTSIEPGETTGICLTGKSAPFNIDQEPPYGREHAHFWEFVAAAESKHEDNVSAGGTIYEIEASGNGTFSGATKAVPHRASYG